MCDTLKALASYAAKLSTQNKFGEIEQLLVKIACGEYLQQVAGGIPMNQTEFFRVENLGLDLKAIRACALYSKGNTRENRAALIELMQEQQGELTFGNCGLDDTINDMRTTMQRFVAAKVAPHAHHWHLENSYVPMEIIQELVRTWCFRPHPSGKFWRPWPAQGSHVRRLRRTFARLDCRGFPRHPRRNRLRTHSPWRHAKNRKPNGCPK